MARKLQTLNRTYFIKWTPADVCYLFELKSIKAEQLIQLDELRTRSLIRELYLLACKASLNSINKSTKESSLLSSYAKRIKQISDDYKKLFGRNDVSENVSQIEQINEPTINIDRLQARLFYLITQYSMHPCVHLAEHIVKQLTILCQHPHIELMPAQHYIYCQSINYWRSKLLQNDATIDRPNVH